MNGNEVQMGRVDSSVEKLCCEGDLMAGGVCVGLGGPSRYESLSARTGRSGPGRGSAWGTPWGRRAEVPADPRCPPPGGPGPAPPVSGLERAGPLPAPPPGPEGGGEDVARSRLLTPLGPVAAPRPSPRPPGARGSERGSPPCGGPTRSSLRPAEAGPLTWLVMSEGMGEGGLE